jgi:hypothetical protein
MIHLRGHGIVRIAGLCNTDSYSAAKQCLIAKLHALNRPNANVGIVRVRMIDLACGLSAAVRARQGTWGASRHTERAINIRQRIHASLSATIVTAILTFLSTAAETAGQQAHGSKRPAQQGQEEQASPKKAPQHSTAPAQQEEAASPAVPAEPEPQAVQTTASHPGVDIVVPGGKVEAVLARDMTARSEPLSPTREFAEDAKQIYLVLTSALANAASVQASLFGERGADTAQPEAGRLDAASRARPARSTTARGLRGRVLAW